MGRWLGTFLFGGILGFAGGAGAMLVVFPFLFPPPMVNDALDQSDGLLVEEASFREGLSGQDPFHWGRGDLKIYQQPEGGFQIEFQTNFEVGAGPNFWIYLNSDEFIDNERQFQADKERVRLTKLKSFQGSQVYAATAEQMKNVKAITIWCESFHQFITSANVSLG